MPWCGLSISPRQGQRLEVGEMGEVGQAGDVVVREVQVHQLDKVGESLQFFILYFCNYCQASSYLLLSLWCSSDVETNISALSNDPNPLNKQTSTKFCGRLSSVVSLWFPWYSCSPARGTSVQCIPPGSLFLIFPERECKLIINYKL